MAQAPQEFTLEGRLRGPDQAAEAVTVNMQLTAYTLRLRLSTGDVVEARHRPFVDAAI